MNRNIIDRAHLARYTLGDAGLEQEVLELFAGQMPQCVEALRESPNAESWSRAAHTIKGSAKVVGAWKLAEAAQRAEHVSSCREQWPDLIADIEAAVREVNAEIAGNVLVPA